MSGEFSKNVKRLPVIGCFAALAASTLSCSVHPSLLDERNDQALTGVEPPEAETALNKPSATRDITRSTEAAGLLSRCRERINDGVSCLSAVAIMNTHDRALLAAFLKAELDGVLTLPGTDQSDTLMKFGLLEALNGQLSPTFLAERAGCCASTIATLSQPFNGFQVDAFDDVLRALHKMQLLLPEPLWIQAREGINRLDEERHSISRADLIKFAAEEASQAETNGRQQDLTRIEAPDGIDLGKVADQCLQFFQQTLIPPIPMFKNWEHIEGRWFYTRTETSGIQTRWIAGLDKVSDDSKWWECTLRREDDPSVMITVSYERFRLAVLNSQTDSLIDEAYANRKNETSLESIRGLCSFDLASKGAFGYVRVFPRSFDRVIDGTLATSVLLTPRFGIAVR